ncbi:DUF5691 domain-containing protein [Granulicoccus sp. GXG6511]|uniref:DUF5691 domain-containing protein n=1 Tax=Granulicoccus sp. GXG6511 TaxID=3381351 RepID=UPI003D7D6C76
MSALDPLIPVAVVGTARRELDPAALAALTPVDGLAGSSAAQTLLVAAARAAIIDRVTLPAGGPIDDPGPEPETVPAPDSPFYVGTLQQAIGGQRWSAVRESLRFLVETRQRLPVGALQPLLEEAVTRPELRAELWPVLGSRGRWLAGRNPSWGFAEWAVPDLDDDTAWRTGTLTDRLAWLRALRAADPARARTLLAERLPSQSSAERRALVETLRVGLAPADEPFLDGALDDRAPSVRALVRELLATLPESGFVARMRERLRHRLILLRGRWGINFAGLTPADERDGVVVDIRERPPGAAAVRALTAAMPLGAWPVDHGLTPLEVLGLRADPVELGPVPGLRDAAVREQDAELAREILLHPRGPADVELLAVLKAEDVDPVLARLALAGDPHDVLPLLRLRGFGPETARALLIWSSENRNHGRRGPILGVLGDHGPLDTDHGDLAADLRQRAGAFLAADRSRALDAAMTINLRRSLRAEAIPPFSRQPLADQEPS